MHGQKNIKLCVLYADWWEVRNIKFFGLSYFHISKDNVHKSNK